jgi:hypothetical protein
MVHQVFAILFLSVLSSGSAFVLKPSRDSYHDSFACLDRQRTSTRMATQPTASEGTSVDQETLKQVLAVAIEASKKAGDIILGNAGGAEITKSKANSRDLLTLIDPLCEKVREKSIKIHVDHNMVSSMDLTVLFCQVDYPRDRVGDFPKP